MKQQIKTLKKAFDDCKRTETSQCLYKSSYEIVSFSTFFVFDDKNEQPIQIRQDGDYQLIVRNQNKKEICVIKTDKCLFTDEHKKCDCILFNSKQFFLVEIKDAHDRSSQRSKAVSQLQSTIDILLERNILLAKYETKAIICFKSGKTQPLRASFNTQRAIFFEKYKINLEEGNEVKFD